jgi:hypothetical protein
MSPDPVLFVARNLDVWPVPANLAGDSLAFSTSARPYFRLTPAVWRWLWAAVDNLTDNPKADRAQVQAAAELVVTLGRWVDAYYPAKAIAAAWVGPPALPDAPKPPPDAIEPSCGGFVSHYFPLSVVRPNAPQTTRVQHAAPPAAA